MENGPGREALSTSEAFLQESLAEFQIGETHGRAADIPAEDLSAEVRVRSSHVDPTTTIAAA